MATTRRKTTIAGCTPVARRLGIAAVMVTLVRAKRATAGSGPRLGHQRDPDAVPGCEGGMVGAGHAVPEPNQGAAPAPFQAAKPASGAFVTVTLKNDVESYG